jgi:hypothetical protein
LQGHGTGDVRKVRAAYIESDGMISVISRGGELGKPPRKRAGIRA